MKNVTFLALLVAGVQAQAQQFLPPIETFSSKKNAYLITTKGERVEFILDDLDRKRGLIYDVEGKTLDGKKFDYKAEEIQEMGLPPSNFAKFASATESTNSIARAKRTDVSQVGRELVLFFQEYLDDDKRTVLVQLLNPTFADKIRVYDDPFAAETAGIGFAGVQMTGGMDKSFYVKHGGKTFRLKKKNYDEYIAKFYGSCPDMLAKFKSMPWRDFAAHVFYFDQSCQ